MAECLQCAAQGVTADLELRRELGLDDPVARRERAGQDALAEVLRDLGRAGSGSAFARMLATVAANPSRSVLVRDRPG